VCTTLLHLSSRISLLHNRHSTILVLAKLIAFEIACSQPWHACGLHWPALPAFLQSNQDDAHQPILRPIEDIPYSPTALSNP
jgi:hypothetical protein